MMNMLAGNKRSRPIEDAELLKRTDELPTHQQYGAVWKQLTDMGHDEELVRMWATENEIIAKGQECYDRISAPVAMQHDDHIVGASQDQSIRILIDGGSFHHNFGTDTVQYRTNIRSITPFPITTAGGITWLDKQCDLNMPGIILTNGYINDHLHITLLSEGILAKEKKWSFKTDVEGKLCTHPQGSFMARPMGHLFYLPNHIIGIPPMVMAGVDELMAAMDEPDSDDEMHMVYESEGEEAAAPDHDPADMSDSDDDNVQMLTEEEFIQAVAARKAAKAEREAVENQLHEMQVKAEELRAEAARIKAMAASMQMPVPVHMERQVQQAAAAAQAAAAPTTPPPVVLSPSQSNQSTPAMGEDTQKPGYSPHFTWLGNSPGSPPAQAQAQVQNPVSHPDPGPDPSGLISQPAEMLTSTGDKDKELVNSDSDDEWHRHQRIQEAHVQS